MKYLELQGGNVINLSMVEIITKEGDISIYYHFGRRLDRYTYADHFENMNDRGKRFIQIKDFLGDCSDGLLKL